jgi:hypothetical protein
MTPAKLFAPGAIDPILERIKNEARAAATVLDISTDKGRKAIASLAYKVARTKTFIDDQRLKLVADEKKRLSVIDAEGKRVREELDALKDEVRNPLTEWEDADKARIAKLELGVIALAAFSAFEYSVTTAEIQDRMNNLEGTTTSNFEEFTHRAEYAKSASLNKLRSMLESSQKADAERAELERLRAEAIEREAREAKEKAGREEKERAEAYAQILVKQAEEKAERERKAAADEAEQERIRIENEKRDAEARAAKAIEDARIAAEKAKADAESAKLQAAAHARALVEKAELDRIAAELKSKQDQEAAIQRERERVERENKAAADALAAREANKRHKGRINREILEALIGSGFDEATGKSIIELIAKGKVPHVGIQY